MLNDKHFHFWFSLFHRTIPHVDLLYDQLQSRSVCLTVSSTLGDFYNIVPTLRNEILTSEISEPPELKEWKWNKDLTNSCERGLWNNLVSSKGMVQVYQLPLCSKIFGVWTVSSIATTDNILRRTFWIKKDCRLNPLLWKERISSSIQGFKPPSNKNKTVGWKIPFLKCAVFWKSYSHLWQQSRRDAFPQWKE
jgi:hypothetical protein